MRRGLRVIRNALEEEVTAEGLRRYYVDFSRRFHARLVILGVGALAHGALLAWWSALALLIAGLAGELLEERLSRRLRRRPPEDHELPRLRRLSLWQGLLYGVGFSLVTILTWTKDAPGATFLAIVVALACMFDAGFLVATNRLASIAKIACYLTTLAALFATAIALDGWSVQLGMELMMLVVLSYVVTMSVHDVRRGRRRQTRTNAALAERGAALERALAALTEKERAMRRLAVAAEHAGDSIVITDAEDRIEWVNGGFTARTGLTLRDVSDRPGRLAADPEADPAIYEALHRAIDARRPFRGELRLWCRGDRWVWFHVCLTPLFDEEGRFANYVSVERDISELKAREAELARAQADAARLALVAEHARDCVVIYSAHGVIEWVNPAFTEQTGYRAHEAIGRSIGSFTVDGAEQEAVREARRAMGRGRALRAVILSRRRDGEPFWCDASLVPIRDGAGRITNWISVERDVSELKAREAELARKDAENRRLALVTRHATDSIMLADAAGRVEWINESFARESGWTIEDVRGRHVRSFVAPDCDPGALTSLRATVEAERTFRAELPVARPGGPVWHDVVATPIHEDGAIRHWVVVERDITEKKAREAALEEAERENRRLALVARHSGDCILMTDAAGVIEWSNAAHESATGISAAELKGGRLASFAAPDCDTEALAAIQAATRARRPHRSQLKLMRRGGSVWHDVRQTPIHDEDGTLIHWINAERDITDLKAREEELAEARRAAEAAAEAKSSFLATMSHELRTPMNGVIGTADLLAETPLDDDQRKLLSTIALSSEALLRIIDDILDLSKLEAGRMEIEPQPFDPADLAQLCAQLVRPLAERKGLALGVEAGPGTSERLLGDPGRLRQILLNLLGNAIKFTEAGRVDLRLRAEPGEGGRRLVLAVADTGIGIAPDRLGGVFDAFTQADGTITRRFGGTGLGLSISRRLARAMGGELEVASTPGEGSVFSLALVLPPAGEAAPPPMSVIEGEAPPRERPPAGGLVLVPDPAGPPPAADAPLVLVVDDNATNRFLVERMLGPLGLRVAHAEDGAEGVAAFGRLRPALVVMDVSMPVMDGLEATRRIRALEGELGVPRPCPILALTANARPGDLVEGGVTRFLSKPIRKVDLHDAVAAAVAPGEGGAAAALGGRPGIA